MKAIAMIRSDRLAAGKPPAFGADTDGKLGHLRRRADGQGHLLAGEVGLAGGTAARNIPFPRCCAP